MAVKRMKRVWEGGWKQASKLGELVVSHWRHPVTPRSAASTDTSRYFASLYARSRIILLSSPCTTPFFSLTPRSSISCSSVWRGTFIS